MRVEKNTLTPEQFQPLFTSAGWMERPIEQVKVALENSLVTFAVYEDDKLIGMARLLGDCAMAYYLKDFVIYPEYQGKGIGRAVIQYIEDYIRSELQEGWAVAFELMSAGGKEGFYKKLGFEEKVIPGQGTGMYKRIAR